MTSAAFLPAQMRNNVPQHLKDWLKECAYKPGWTFELLYNARMGDPTVDDPYAPVYPGWHLVIQSYTLNSVDPTKATSILFCLPFDELNVHQTHITKDVFHMGVLRRCLDVEHHEAMEFFRVNGVRLRNPHPVGKGALYDVVPFFPRPTCKHEYADQYVFRWQSDPVM